jgi:hypothetical protein
MSIILGRCCLERPRDRLQHLSAFSPLSEHYAFAQVSKYLRDEFTGTLAVARLRSAVGDLKTLENDTWNDSRIAEVLVHAPEELQQAALVHCPTAMALTAPPLLLTAVLASRCALSGEPELMTLTLPEPFLATAAAQRCTAAALVELPQVQRLVIIFRPPNGRTPRLTDGQTHDDCGEPLPSLHDLLLALPAIPVLEIAERWDQDTAKLLAALPRDIRALRANLATGNMVGAGLAQLKQVERLICTGCMLGDEDLVSLASLTRLSRLELNADAFSERSLRHLVSLPSLRHLRLSTLVADIDAEVANMARLSRLTYLRLETACDLTDFHLKRLAHNMTNLQVLDTMHHGFTQMTGHSQAKGALVDSKYCTMRYWCLERSCHGNLQSYPE